MRMGCLTIDGMGKIKSLDYSNGCYCKAVMVDGSVLRKAELSGIMSLLPLTPPAQKKDT